jgi:TRAP-type C4-dicarboxylate transport system permease small subunit
MKLLDWLIGLTRSISRFAVWIAGAFMLVSVLLVGAEVIGRKLGILRITGASEMGGYMLAVCSSWAFSFTLLNRSNIRFDALYALCGPLLRGVFDLVALVVLAAFAVTLAWYGWGVLFTSLRLGSHSTSSLAMPLWIPQGVWWAGLAFLTWTSMLLSLRVLVALLQRDYATIVGLARIEMPAEEVERERESAALVLDHAAGSNGGRPQ